MSRFTYLFVAGRQQFQSVQPVKVANQSDVKLKEAQAASKFEKKCTEKQRREKLSEQFNELAKVCFTEGFDVAMITINMIPRHWV